MSAAIRGSVAAKCSSGVTMCGVCLRSGKCFAQRRLFVLMTIVPKTQLTWYGQSGFKIVTPGSKVLLIDPWLTNPVFEKGKDELAALKDVNSPPIDAGTPAGLVICIRDGPTVYHTGDTGFFSDIARVSDYNKIDIMLVCIGDHFTMGPIRAADAVKLVGPEMVIPMHHGTFPVLTGTPEAFGEELKKRGAKSELRVMKVGETITV